MRSFDYNKLKDYKWDSEILGLVAQIHEYKGRQELYLKQKPAALDRLIEIAKIQSTEASNKIEGIVTTTTRIQQLCMDKTTPRNRDEEEIMGYRDVLNTIHESYEYIPIRSSYILQLHRDLYKYSEKAIGGRYKNTQNIIAETKEDGTQVVRFTPMEPYETPDAIEAICESFNQVIDSCVVDALLLILVFIHDFLCIHPFNDGNGRMSRLLTTLLLYRQGYVVGRYISIESKIEKTKEKYYEVLGQCGIGWHEGEEDFTPFIKYLLGIILAAYRDFESRINLVDNKLPAIEQVRAAVQEKIGKFTKSEIMELVPSIGKASVENSLKKLTEEGVIEKHGKGKATFYTRTDVR
ncbi:MAG: Fic family protein [Lachnospiraceae bacterium]|nr:Fic family protein [Lachnospiraceae bacterium]